MGSAHIYKVNSVGRHHQTSRRVSSVVRTLSDQGMAVATSGLSRLGGGDRHLTGRLVLSGFGLTETLVQFQHSPESFLFVLFCVLTRFVSMILGSWHHIVQCVYHYVAHSDRA